ncbi:MAG TPA: hypothetical protein VFA67_01405 [Candidatus Sulfotelmatobacter sp.]|nr:hypothetical protein [Candidatus Sulfotelmatobacter sp.]
MKQRVSVLRVLAALCVIPCITGAAIAQEDTMPAHPRYVRLQPQLQKTAAPPATPLTTWNGSFSYLGTTYNYNMVGTDPSTGTSTTVQVFAIPVVLSYKTSTGTVTFSPGAKQSNGLSAGQNILNSPLFQKMDFTSGGTHVGVTQYIDAYQRANFWGQVSSHTGYHVLLSKPTVLPALVLTVPASVGRVATEFGVRVGLADIFWFDAQIQNYMKNHTQIVPNSLPLFVTYNVYLTQFGGCCIGGYHSSFGTLAAPQAYAQASYIGTSGAFAQDVSALSHELGEWMDDPLVVNVNGNTVSCGILENGDPEEGFANYGGFPYTLNGFTYNLQDLVFLPYFGAPASTSVNNSLTFQGNPFGLGICSNGG